MKKIILFAFLLSSISAFAQLDATKIQRTTGIVEYLTTTAMNADTPAGDEAIVAIVGSEIYVWGGATWDAQGGIIVNDGTTIDFTYVTGTKTLTGEVSQNGATTGQIFRWDGANWSPHSLTAADVPIVDAGSIITATNTEAALQELKGLIDDLVTLSGVSAGANTLGTFTGTTIADNQTVKAAIQELETAVETKLTIYAGTYSTDALASAGGVPLGGYYQLSDTNVYGESGLRKRK